MHKIDLGFDCFMVYIWLFISQSYETVRPGFFYAENDDIN